MCLFSWEMLKNAVTLKLADPPRDSIRCDKFGNQRWHRTNRDQEAPCRRTSRNWGTTATICYSDSRKGDFLDGNPHSLVYEQKS